MDKSNLYITATPIGNLKDITLRALEILNDCPLIICENSHSAYKLFDLLNIPRKEKTFIQYGDFNNKEETVLYIIDKIKQFNKAALITEAGTPLISDPGFKIVKQIREFHSEEIKISPIPGVSAITAFLSVSGLPTDNFTFFGFLPKTSGRRENIIKSLQAINEIQKTTFVFYESKYKLLDLLRLIALYHPHSTVSIGEDITKMHEKIHFGKIDLILEHMSAVKSIKGEFIVQLSV